MRILLLILLCFSFVQLSALDKISVNEKTELIKLKNLSYKFSDSTQELSINQITNLPNYFWKQENLSGYSLNAEWILIPFINETDHTFDKVLYLNNLYVLRADFHFVVDGKIQSDIVRTGLARSNNVKLYRDPMYPVRVHFPANSDVDVLIRVMDPMTGVHNSPFFLLSYEQAISLKDRRLVFSYLWFGILLLSLVLSVFIYISIKQRIFLYYIFLAISTGMIIASNIGFLTSIMDTDPYQVITNMFQIGAALLVVFLPRFLNCIVPISRISQIAWKGILWVGYLSVIVAVLYCLPIIKNNYQLTSYIITTLVQLSSLAFLYLLIVLGIAAFRRIPLSITLFFVYLIYLGLAFGVVIFPQLGMETDGINTFYLMLAGSIFEIVAFMLLMAQVTLSVYREREFLNKQVQENQEVLMNTLVKNQEDERKRFAIDLHNGFGQMISSLNLNLSSLKKIKTSNTEKRIEAFRSSSVILEDMYVELKTMCFNLMPHTLISAGVGEALREFANRINHSRDIIINVSLFDMDIRLAQVMEISLYRISQEWINNIIEHSNASVIDLQITRDHEEITLLIEDDGMGFDQNLIVNGEGNGWKNINSRINLVKGEVEIDTKAGLRGTTFIANAPLNLKHKKTKEEVLDSLNYQE